MKRMLMRAAPVIGALAWRNRSKIRRWLSERNADEGETRRPEGAPAPTGSRTDNGQHREQVADARSGA